MQLHGVAERARHIQRLCLKCLDLRHRSIPILQSLNNSQQVQHLRPTTAGSLRR